MANRYTTTEVGLVDLLLKKVPRSASGCLPYNEWRGTQEWKALATRHTDNSIQAFLAKRWRMSVIPVQPNLPIQPTPPPAEVHLNHAYNFCPGCGMKLN